MDQSEPERTKGTEVDWKDRFGPKWTKRTESDRSGTNGLSKTIMDRNGVFLLI